MKADTAERLTALALEMSDALNEIVRDIKANETEEEVVRLRQATSRVMWAIYFDLLKPAFDEHPWLEPEPGTAASAALKLGPNPRTPRAAGRASTRGSRRPQPPTAGRRRPR
jgi:hypothetical protein